MCLASQNMVYISEHFSNHVPVENGDIRISFHSNMLYP